MRVKDKAAIGDLLTVRALDPERADQQGDAVLGRGFAERCYAEVFLLGLNLLVFGFTVLLHEMRHFGRGDEFRADLGGCLYSGECVVDIALHICPGAHLYQGNFHALSRQ